VNGQQACYLAFSRSNNVLYLVNDQGSGLLPGQLLAVASSISNSQCTVAWGSNPVSPNGNSLSLGVNIAFNASFVGNQVIYMAARDANEANGTDWQATGTWTVQ